MDAFDKTVREHLGKGLTAAAVETIQVNLGLRCNMCCRHCHVAAGPDRQEIMAWSTMEKVLGLAAAFPGCLMDLTGGAPELNPHFVPFVEALRTAGHPVQVRTNLTVFFEPGMVSLPDLFRRHEVQLVASLPCYLDGNVAAQRGAGAYEKSITALRTLNGLGYGLDPGLSLNLVYNPGGPFLPPDQEALEGDYRRQLQERHGIAFTRLLAITNMPIGRFLHELNRQGKADDYRALLRDAFNPQTVEGLMCRHQISVAWDGILADCDFNQALGLALAEGLPRHLDQVDPASLPGRRIITGAHCFGCTAGCGSSCGGALVA